MEKDIKKIVARKIDCSVDRYKIIKINKESFLICCSRGKINRRHRICKVIGSAYEIEIPEIK